MRSRGLISSARQVLKRFVWSNKPTLGCATRAVGAAYLVRKWLGLTGPGSVRSAPIVTAAEDLRPFQRYKTEFGWVEGWFTEQAVATWDSLLALQRALGLRGNLLEIGVYKGKSAALMALHARPEETCVFLDPALRREATDVIRAVRAENNVWVREMSQNIRNDERLEGLGGTFRWIHIDGEHSARAVMNDLEIAETLASPEAVICLDDFMNSAYPQITMAAFRFLDRRAAEFTLFLSGFNKGYVCRSSYAPMYLEFLRERLLGELKRRALTDVTIWKSTEPADMNCFGLTPSYRQFEYRGPDWAPDTIPIR